MNNLVLKDKQLGTCSSAYRLPSGDYCIFGMWLAAADTDRLLAWLKVERR